MKKIMSLFAMMVFMIMSFAVQSFASPVADKGPPGPVISIHYDQICQCPVILPLNIASSPGSITAQWLPAVDIIYDMSCLGVIPQLREEAITMKLFSMNRSVCYSTKTLAITYRLRIVCTTRSGVYKARDGDNI